MWKRQKQIEWEEIIKSQERHMPLPFHKNGNGKLHKVLGPMGYDIMSASVVLEGRYFEMRKKWCFVLGFENELIVIRKDVT